MIDKLATMLEDADSYVRSSAASALGGIGEADAGVIDRLVKMLGNADSYVRRIAAFALGSIGEVDERRLGVLRRICDERERFDGYVIDPEGNVISATQLAFRMLWRNAPSE